MVSVGHTHSSIALNSSHCFQSASCMGIGVLSQSNDACAILLMRLSGILAQSGFLFPEALGKLGIALSLNILFTSSCLCVSNVTVGERARPQRGAHHRQVHTEHREVGARRAALHSAAACDTIERQPREQEHLED